MRGAGFGIKPGGSPGEVGELDSIAFLKRGAPCDRHSIITTRNRSYVREVTCVTDDHAPRLGVNKISRTRRSVCASAPRLEGSIGTRCAHTAGRAPGEAQGAACGAGWGRPRAGGGPPLVGLAPTRCRDTVRRLRAMLRTYMKCNMWSATGKKACPEASDTAAGVIDYAADRI